MDAINSLVLLTPAGSATEDVILSAKLLSFSWQMSHGGGDNRVVANKLLDEKSNVFLTMLLNMLKSENPLRLIALNTMNEMASSSVTARVPILSAKCDVLASLCVTLQDSISSLDVIRKVLSLL